MRSLILPLIIHLTLNILVFLKGWDVFKKQKVLRTIWSIIFSFEFVTYIVGFIFFRHLPAKIAHPIYLMGTSWMLFLLYFGSLILIFDFLYLVFKKQLTQPKELLNQPQKLKLTIFLSSIALVVLVLFYGGYKFNYPEVQQVNIEINKPAREMESVRIAMIGDLHLGYLINRDDAQRMVDLIMEQKADLILFVGDILDSRIEPILEHKMDEELRRIYAPLGVYSCTGNHEYRFEAEQKIQWLNDVGITMLRDSAVLIDSSFYVVGREDFVYPNRLPLREILKQQNVDLSKPVIVLNHNPLNLDEEINAEADLALYGHTHHGQAFPGNIATHLVFEIAYGYAKKGNTHIYVTSGLGLAGPQYRIGTVSEIVVLNVKFGY
ncbi:MAG: metallophosphoesterase [Bacteroidia bacterium]|nr:metallophosphoesterase [Bacteroidia bacterium]